MKKPITVQSSLSIKAAEMCYRKAKYVVVHSQRQIIWRLS
jgi:hypothetical protein